MICNDLHPYLIAMWRGVQQGYELPDVVTREQYYYIKEHKDEDPVLAGFVGFGCAFGGKWFSGYGYAKDVPDGLAKRSKGVVMRQIQALKDAEFLCMDYRDVPVPEGATIYADPPYANVGTGYNTGNFDNAAFWDYARGVSETNLIFISEQSAPEDFTAVWERPLRRQLSRNKERLFDVTEKLYVHKSVA